MKRNFRGFFLLAASALCVLSVQAAKPRIIAHQGYWKAEGCARNSISSLKAAAGIGAWGSEFDVNVTRDMVPIVNHDETLAGKVIMDTPYSAFADVKLANGEKIPTLAEYLEEGVKHPKMKLILEIKSARTPEHETRAVDAVMAEVKRAGAEKQVEYIAFSRHVVETLIARDPRLKVYYLNGDIAPKELKEMGCTGLDYHIKVLRRHPEWFAEARGLGLKVNAWTLDDPDDFRFIVSHKGDYITTNLPEDAMKVVSGKE